MANKFTRFLTGVANGLTSPRGMPSDYRHATRIFIDDSLRLSPRNKFNFYVRFEFNPDALAAQSQNFTRENINEAGILVKNVELPSYAFDTRTLNQYNRKKILYTMLNYNPISFDLHDDSYGVTNALWAIYYSHYVRDRKNNDAAYTATRYKPYYSQADGEALNYRYGLDNNLSKPLLKKIHLYTMSRKRFVSYSLVNPKITSWQHSEMDHSLNEFANSRMQVEYEAVQYGGGRIQDGNPEGFTTLHYDTLPSPLTLAGGGTGSLLGEGGVLDGLETIFGAVGPEGNAFDSPESFLSTAVKAVNTYENFKNLSLDDIAGEAVNILTSPGAAENLSNTISGISATFTRNDSATATTTASQKNLTDTEGSS